MTRNEKKIGQEELAVLQFVHENYPVSVRDAAEHFAEQGKARTTILTVMERLRAKKFLTRKKQGSAFQYSPISTQVEDMNSVVGEFVQKMLGGSVSPFVAYMSETQDVSEEELKELKKLVRELDKSRKEKKK